MAIVAGSDAGILSTWRSAVSGEWSAGSNWSTSPTYPNNNTGSPPSSWDAVIGAAGSPFTVTVGNYISVTTLGMTSPNARLQIDFGGRLDVRNTLTLSGGSITLGGNVPAGFPAQSDLRFGTESGAGPCSINGSGTVLFLSGGTNVFAGSTPLTIGAGITLRTDTGDGIIAAQTNQGTIQSTGNGRSIWVMGTTNTGAVQASAGGSLRLTDCNNQGAVTITGGGTLTLEGSTVNSGLMSAVDSTLVLGNATPALVNSITRANAPLILNGILENTGTSFVMKMSQGKWSLAPGGQFKGGTLASDTADPLAILPPVSGVPSPILDGVALDVDTAGSAADLIILNGLTLNNRTMASSPRFSGTQTLSGVGTVSMLDGVLSAVSGTLTIGSGITVGERVTLDTNPTTQGFLVNNGTITNLQPSKSLQNSVTLNNGTISVPASKSISVVLGTNAGSVLVNGGTLTVIGCTNNGTIAANGGTLTINGNWSNPGTISENNANVFLGGTFTTAGIGNLQATGGSVNLTGRLINTGATFALNTTSWHILNAGRILNGTVNAAGGAQLFGHDGGVLDHVALNAPLTLDKTSGIVPFITFTAFGGANNNGVLIPGSCTFDTTDYSNQGSITLGGGALLLRGAWNNAGFIGGTGTISTFGTWTPAQLGNADRAAITLVIADTFNNSGKTFTVDNVGTWQLGGTLSGGTLSSTNGGVLRVAGSNATIGSIALEAPIRVSTAGTLLLNGGVSLANSTISLGDSVTSSTATGLVFSNAQFASQALSGNGQIVFDALRSAANFAPQAIVLPFGTVTLGSGITVRTGLGSGTVGNQTTSAAFLINQGTISSQTANRGILVTGRLNNQGTIEARNGGTLTVNFSSATSIANYANGVLTGGNWAAYANSTLSFGSSTITTNAASILLDGVGSTFAAVNSLTTNQGLFTITNGRNFTTLSSLTNSGTVVVSNNSRLTILNALNNTGTVDLNSAMIVDYLSSTPIDAISQQVASGYANGAWNGIGISSSAAALVAADNSNPNKTAVGYADASTLGVATFAGQSVDTTAVLLRYTLVGDVNLDGIVNSTDQQAVTNHLNSAGRWSDGDFNFDGMVSDADLAALNTNFGLAIPEPTSISLLALWPLLRRNRRRFTASP